MKNCLADFKLDWVLLGAAALCPSNPEGFFSPIEVAQTEIGYLTAAKAVDEKQKDDCPGTEIKSACAVYDVEKSFDLGPGRSDVSRSFCCSEAL
jgi:hypothetical protein